MTTGGNALLEQIIARETWKIQIKYHQIKRRFAQHLEALYGVFCAQEYCWPRRIFKSVQDQVRFRSVVINNE